MTIAVKDVKQAKPLPAPNSDFYQLADVLTADEKAIVKKVRDYMETQGPADHQQVLVRRCVSVRAAAVLQGAAARRPGIRGLWLRRRKPEAVRLRRDGAGTRRRVVLHVLRRAQRPGDGLDLSRRIGGAEAEVAAADGALGKDRLLRPHRAAGRFGNQRRPDRRPRSARATPGSSTARSAGSATRRGATSRSSGRAMSPTTRSRASSSRTRPRPASASRRSSTRSRSRSSRTARSR